MRKISEGFDLRTQAISFIAPIVGGLLFLAVSFITDLYNGYSYTDLTYLYLFEKTAYAAAGALVAGSLFAARSLILASARVEGNIIQIPMSTSDTSGDAIEQHLMAIRNLNSLFTSLSTVVKDPLSRQLAAAALNNDLGSQAVMLRETGRFRFSNPIPSDILFMREWNADLDPGLLDHYAFLTSFLKSGDLVYSTEFGNSKFWLLRNDIVYNFMAFNIALLKRGISVRRIFGVNRSRWNEDEQGMKHTLIQLQADIVGMEVYTIDYDAFSRENPFRLEEIDALVPVRGSSILPCIEWQIDDLGQVQRVYHVFGQERKTVLRENADSILNLEHRSSYLEKIAPQDVIDVRTSQGFELIWRRISEMYKGNGRPS